MEISGKNKQIFLAAGLTLLLLSSLLIVNYLRSDWKIRVAGNQTIPPAEIEGYVRFYLQQNPENISSADIEQILGFHPRIQTAKVSKTLKTISVYLTEKQTGFMEHRGGQISELSTAGMVIQESIPEKEHLSENFPIFYLTAENEPEIETIKGDIIQLWQKTGSSHSFLWSRISEIELVKNEMNNIQINLYHSFFPFKISFYDKMDLNSLRKLWALFNLLESKSIEGWKVARVYQDHAVLE